MIVFKWYFICEINQVMDVERIVFFCFVGILSYLCMYDFIGNIYFGDMFVEVSYVW